MMQYLRCGDPGTGARLGPEIRDELAQALRVWQRNPPGSVLIEIEQDAWAAADAACLATHHAITSAQALVTRLRELGCPVVVSLSGAATGLGTALLLAADVRFGSDAASVAAGDSPAAALLAGTAVPEPLATTVNQLAWTGERLGSEAAIAAGLLTCRGPVEAARASAERLAGNPGWAAVKRAARGGTRTSPPEALRYRAWLLDLVVRG